MSQEVHKKHRGAFWALLFGVLLLWVAPALAADPSPLDRARTLAKQQRWEEALVAFREVLKQDPANVVAQANLGVALSQLNRHKEALLAYDAALARGYDSADFRYLRGLSLLQLGLLEDAAREMETALDKNPLMPETLYDLGLIYILQGRREEAVALVSKLYRRNNLLSEKLFREIPPAYKITAVDQGGRIKGRVTLKGPVPKPRAFHLIHSPNIQFCSRISDGRGHRILHDFVVGAGGGLKDTVVALQGVRRGKPFPKKIQTIRIDRCRADRYVIGLQNGEEFLLENTDPIRHEIATYQNYHSKVLQTSNKAVTAKTSQVRSAFVKPGSEEFTIKCNLHPFLQTHGLFVDNPYYAVTDGEGRFQIDEVPPGTYQVIAWHPFIPIRRGTVTVEAGKDAEIHFEFDSRDERRKLYQNDTKGYRFNTWYDSGELFYGGKRVDDPVEILQTFDNSQRYETDGTLNPHD